MGLAKIQKRTWARPRRGRWNPSEACLLITATHAHQQDTTHRQPHGERRRFRSNGCERGPRNVLQIPTARTGTGSCLSPSHRSRRAVLISRLLMPPPWVSLSLSLSLSLSPWVDGVQRRERGTNVTQPTPTKIRTRLSESSFVRAYLHFRRTPFTQRTRIYVSA